MRVIPSIDIVCSKRVEVVGHDVERVFEDLPVETALFWEKAGASMIHVVDIDAALGAGRSNTGVIERIIRSVKIPVQVAGGIRIRRQVEELLSMGASRVVVRPRPCSESVVEDFSGLSIVLGIDYMGSNRFRDVGKNSIVVGEDRVVSWVSELGCSIGLSGVLVTDVGAEGSLKGIRKEALGFLKKLSETGLEVMYAGGVSSVEDVLSLRNVGVKGVIIGKALYNGLLSLRELRRVSGNE